MKMKKLVESSVISNSGVPSCSIKALLYKQLQPIASVNGMKLLVLSREDSSIISDVLHKKCKTFGISPESERNLYNKLDSWYQCIVILKSVGKYYGASEIARIFNIDKSYVEYLTSKNAKKYPAWGDLDVKNDLFLYWFPIQLSDFNDFRT